MANKQDLIAKVAEATELTKKDSAAAVDAVFASIEEFLAAGEKVQLIGFGNFEVRERAARQGRNPQTGETISIAASKVPAFKAGKALKDAATLSAVRCQNVIAVCGAKGSIKLTEAPPLTQLARISLNAGR